MQKIGIGYENYKDFIDENMYYVDKTLIIRDILEKGGKVTLFTRPRRFGKTLALSTLRTFFEAEIDREGNAVDNSRYFENRKIMDCGEGILSKMGRYPVISLSLKSAKQSNFRDAFIALRNEIINEYERHGYIIGDGKVSSDNIKAYKELRSARGDWSGKLESCKTRDEREELFKQEVGNFCTSLRLLSECLKQYHGKNTIILIDEYDVPLENAYFNGFYDEMVEFIRSLFESALKTNDALEFAVVTGCLRISRESIFTGLNHLEIFSVMEGGFSEAFGFTEEETEKMLKDYGLSDKMEEARVWYDGYLFGKQDIYNPWSIIKYVKGIVVDGNKFPKPYWANTSSNSIIKEMVWQADDSVKDELDKLIGGGTIEKKIHEDITYADIFKSQDNLWNFLFFTGYLKKVSERFEDEDIYLTMKIPNAEIKSIYRNQIADWFDEVVRTADRKKLHDAVLSGDTETMGTYVSDLLSKSISYFDGAESFYHGFFLSLLYGVPGYSPRSNREEGNGRPDIVLYPNRPKNPAILFELKTRDKFNQMEDGLEEAFEQIRTQKYEEGILDDGYMGSVSYGVCFCKKSCIFGKYPG